MAETFAFTEKILIISEMARASDPTEGGAGNLAYWRVSYANVNLRENLAPKAKQT